MRRDFSKPASDVAIEASAAFDGDPCARERQARVSAALLTGEPRSACLICTTALASAPGFRHRDVKYAWCERCGHVQSRLLPPAGYPQSHGGQTFHDVYPALDAVAYASRRDRIYRPKLEWVLSCSALAGRTPDEMLAAKWLELGCGAGYFLAALQQAGAAHYSGIDRDSVLVSTANTALGETRATEYARSLSDAVTELDADIYVAFFALEHIDQPGRFFERLGRSRSGTVFAFSVPTLGFATLLESAFDTHAARSLDSVTHVQLFTDRSIKYCLDMAGYEAVAEWTFGQDATDLQRLLLLSLRGKYDEVVHRRVATLLAQATDPVQAALDRSALADSRHIFAVKT